MIVPALYIEYEITKDYIINNYCVNKNRPELHCDGKCYLSKKIKAFQESEELQARTEFLKHFLEVFPCDLEEYTTFRFISLRQKKQISIYNSSYSNHWFASIFKPPQA